MPHRTEGLSPGQRIVARLVHYVAYTVVFLLVYGGLRVRLGHVPLPVVAGILVASVAKDLFDEYRLWQGRQPLAYAGVEHAPSNVVLLAFLATGIISFTGSIAGIPLEYWAGGVALFDLVFDLSQDMRA